MDALDTVSDEGSLKCIASFSYMYRIGLVGLVLFKGNTLVKI